MCYLVGLCFGRYLGEMVMFKFKEWFKVFLIGASIIIGMTSIIIILSLYPIAFLFILFIIISFLLGFSVLEFRKMY